METVVINATDLRIKTREIMERVKYKGERFLIQTFGQPTAVIISVEEFEKLSSGVSAKTPRGVSATNLHRGPKNEENS